MKVEIVYEAPDSQVLDLNEEQTDLWTEYTDADERARELRINQGWTDETMSAYRKVDEAYEEFQDSISFSLEYPDLSIDTIEEW